MMPRSRSVAVRRSFNVASVIPSSTEPPIKLRPKRAQLKSLCRGPLRMRLIGPLLTFLKHTAMGFDSIVTRNLVWSRIVLVFAILSCTAGAIFVLLILCFTISAQLIYFPRVSLSAGFLFSPVCTVSAAISAGPLL